MYDPSEHTVDQVNDYLDEHPEEAGEVLALEESADSPRVGITEGRHKPAGDTDADEADQESTEVTRGLETPFTGLPEHVEPVMSTTEANQAVLDQNDDEFTAHTQEDADQLGYFGTSPGRVLTGRSDDGLSLQSVLGDDYTAEVQPPQRMEGPAGHYADNGEFIPDPVDDDKSDDQDA